MKKKNLLLGAILVFFALNALAADYNIIGNTVQWENQHARLTVTPHTSFNVLDHNQLFELYTKIDANNVRVAYLFPENPQQPRSIQRYFPPTYGIVRSLLFDLNVNRFDWNYRASGDALNPYFVTVWRTVDRNGVDFNAIRWQGLASDSNFCVAAPMRCFYRDANQVVSGDNWTNQANNFHYLGNTALGHYYYSDDFNVDANRTYIWNLTYRVSERQGKWDLVFFQGDSDCLLTDTCMRKWVLDPWWDSGWLYKVPIQVNAASARNDYEIFVDFNVNTAPHVVANAKNDFSDIRVLNQDENVVLNHFIPYFTVDTNMHLWFEGNVSSGDQNFWVYYGNPNASSTSDFNATFDEYEDFDPTYDKVWVERTPPWQLLNGRYADNSDAAVNTASQFPGSEKTLDGRFALARVNVNPSSSYITVIWGDATTGCQTGGDDIQIGFDNSNSFFVVGTSGRTLIEFPALSPDADHEIIAYKDRFGKWYMSIDGNNNAYHSGSVISDDLYSADLKEICLNSNEAGFGDFSIDEIWYSDANLSTTVQILAPITGVDLNVLSPKNDYWSLVNTNPDNNHSIDFNVLTGGSDHLDLELYLSTTALGFDTKIFDVNLSAIALNPTADYNCGASSIDFSVRRTCHFDWNISGVADGNYYMDFNLFLHEEQAAFQFSSSFVIDNTKPSARWDGNAGTWQRTDANVHLSCVDAFGCDLNTLFYRLDTDNTSTHAPGSVLLFDKNILVRNTLDKNIGIDFNVVDLAGNQSDLNTQFVLIDNTAPTASNTLPSEDGASTSSTTFSFTISVQDGDGSYAQSCDYNAFVDHVVISGQQNQSGTVSADGTTCSVSFATLPITGQMVDINYNITDKVGLRTGVQKSNSWQYSPTSPPGGGDTGGGGGGGGGGTIVIDSNTVGAEFLILTPNTQILTLYRTSPKTYSIRAQTTSDQPFSIALEIDPALEPFLTIDSQTNSLEPGQEFTFRFTARSPDENFSEVSGNIVFNINNGQLEKPVLLTIRPTNQPDFLSFLDGQLFGLPLSLWLVAVVAIAAAYFLTRGV